MCVFISIWYAVCLFGFLRVCLSTHMDFSIYIVMYAVPWYIWTCIFMTHPRPFLFGKGAGHPHRIRSNEHRASTAYSIRERLRCLSGNSAPGRLSKTIVGQEEPSRNEGTLGVECVGMRRAKRATLEYSHSFIALLATCWIGWLAAWLISINE